MTPDVAKTLFTEWGKWQQGNMPNLDYSTINTLGRLKDEAGGASHSTCSVIPDMSVGVQQVEDAINKMHPRTKKVIKAKYIFDWSQKQTVCEYKGFEESEVRQRLDGAVNFFCGRMSNSY
ncbi:MAG: hypothetical protein ACJAVY_001314 [Marinoscillum sp.]|jgi:hypothetical protein